MGLNIGIKKIIIVIICIFIITLLGFVILFIILGPTDEGYRFPLKAGTDSYFRVEIYNDDIWDNIMGPDVNSNEYKITGGERS